MWTFFESTLKGRSHAANGQPCQDKTCCRDIDGTCVMALADGAGSARLSHYGAECVVQRAAEELGRNFESYWNERDAPTARQRLFAVLHESLQELAADKGCELGDLASTLLVVAVRDYRYMLLHIGDGVIGYVVGDTLKVASAPSNGEFANTTVFVTSHDACSQAKIFKGNIGDVTGFVVMSDGPEACLYDHRNNALASGLSAIFKDAACNDPQEVQAGIDEAMTTVIARHTTDDCSMAFMVRRQDEKKDKDKSKNRRYLVYAVTCMILLLLSCILAIII